MAFGEKKEEEGGSVKQIVVRAFVSKNASGNSDRLATLQRPHNNRRRDWGGGGGLGWKRLRFVNRVADKLRDVHNRRLMTSLFFLRTRARRRVLYRFQWPKPVGRETQSFSKFPQKKTTNKYRRWKERTKKKKTIYFHRRGPLRAACEKGQWKRDDDRARSTQHSLGNTTVGLRPDEERTKTNRKAHNDTKKSDNRFGKKKLSQIKPGFIHRSNKKTDG